MTYGELARELGFGEDFEAFLVWTDLYDKGRPAPRADEEVDDVTANALREASREEKLLPSHGDCGHPACLSFH